MIFSSSYIWASYKFGDSLKYVKQQIIFIIMGYVIIFLILKLNSDFFYKNSKLFILISFVLLILVLIPGIGSIRNGSRSWFGIGAFGVQPSEAMKLSGIIFTSKYLYDNKKAYKRIKTILPPIIVIGLAFLLIMLQPDFGTGFILVMSILAILFISGVNIKYFYIMGILGIIGVIGLILIAPYRMDRITSFINPWSDPLGTGFQIIQSLYAIGPGGLLGFGFLNSRQKHFYLPEPQTDFIFSIITEEFGFIGSLVLISLFIILYFHIIKNAINQNNLFGKYLIFGLVFLLLFQTLLILSVVVGLVPITGVTLPFISYGGSSLLVSMISIGIILNISKNN